VSEKCQQEDEDASGRTLHWTFCEFVCSASGFVMTLANVPSSKSRSILCGETQDTTVPQRCPTVQLSAAAHCNPCCLSCAWQTVRPASAHGGTNSNWQFHFVLLQVVCQFTRHTNQTLVIPLYHGRSCFNGTACKCT